MGSDYYVFGGVKENIIVKRILTEDETKGGESFSESFRNVM